MTDTQVNDRIEIPGGPEVAGLRFRRLRDELEYGVLASIENAVAEAEGLGHAPQTAEGIRRWMGPDDWDEAQTLIIADVDGTTVGFGCCGSWREATGARRF